jgi:hypothetical protein
VLKFKDELKTQGTLEQEKKSKNKNKTLVWNRTLFDEKWWEEVHVSLR